MRTPRRSLTVAAAASTGAEATRTLSHARKTQADGPMSCGGPSFSRDFSDGDTSLFIISVFSELLSHIFSLFRSVSKEAEILSSESYSGEREWPSRAGFIFA